MKVRQMATYLARPMEGMKACPMATHLAHLMARHLVSSERRNEGLLDGITLGYVVRLKDC